MKKVMDLIEDQKNDEGLWFTNLTAFEWIAQQDLKALHSEIRLKAKGYKNVMARLPEDIKLRTAGEAYIMQAIKELKKLVTSEET